MSLREIEVLKLLAEGNSAKEIAHILKISTSTVKSHRNTIMKKLDIHTIVGLVHFAIGRGICQVIAQ